jgi:glutathione S-transferase
MIRLALVVANADFVDVRIEAGYANDASYKEAWFAVKHVLGGSILEFPNLPYYLEDDTIKLTQSDAILRHIGRKYNLFPTNMPEYRFDMLSEEIKDLDAVFIRLSYGSGPDGVARWIKEDLPLQLAVWRRIAHSGDSFIDDQDKISILDIKLYCFLRKVKFAQSELNIQPSMHEGWVDVYLKRVENVPQVNAYVYSPHYLHRPLNNPHAMFGNK